jgi:hypothetical protein
MKPITDKCPHCQRVFEYDTCQDTYSECKRLSVFPGEDCSINPPEELTLYLCPDDAGVVAIAVLNHHGEEVYVPSTQEL